jgi:hypothetical protein
MDTGSTCDASGIDVAKTTNFALQLPTCDLYAVCGLFRCILDCEVYMKSNLDLEIQNSIPTENKRLALVTADYEKNKERTNRKTSQQYPANPSPHGARLSALSGVSCVAPETYNVIRSAASCFSTTPNLNHFSTGRAFSSRYFHDYLSADVSAQRPAACPAYSLRGTAGENKAWKRQKLLV